MIKNKVMVKFIKILLKMDNLRIKKMEKIQPMMILLTNRNIWNLIYKKNVTKINKIKF